MLAKILKYEFLSTARIFILLYAALLLMAILNALLLPLDQINASVNVGGVTVLGSPPLNPDGSGSIMSLIYSLVIDAAVLLYSILVIVTFVVTVIISVMRFYQMLGDQGYLWLTLPVKPGTHILGKLICSFVWFIASTIAVLISLGVLFIKTGWISALPEVIEMVTASGFSIWLWLILLIALCVVAWLAGILAFYAAIAAGPSLVKNRLAGCAVAYIAIYIFDQVVSVIMLIIGMFSIRGDLETLQALDVGPSGFENFNLLIAQLDKIGLTTLGISTLCYIVFTIVFYLIAKYFMTRKLNLA